MAKTIKKMKTTVKCLPQSAISPDNSYEYRIAISSDSLYIINSDADKFIECIIEGSDHDAYIGVLECEDDFLDFILICKDYHSRGINLLTLCDIRGLH